MAVQIEKTSSKKVLNSAVPQSRIPYNKPYVAGKELEYIEQAIANSQLSGNGNYTEKCHKWLEDNVEVKKAFLTHSGTAALEMASLIADIQPGDEVIMPSFTFVTTASAFVLRSAIPIFVDIRPDTLNIDEQLIAKAITSKTKAIVPVHYAGVSCDMEKICQIAEQHKLVVIEDAAHALKATYKKRPVGCMGSMSALSFHETKNIIAGEAGALLLNDESMIRRAEIIWEKGTNRKEFHLGLTDKYTWQELGSSFPPSELTAAFLFAQMEEADFITNRRVQIWELYHKGFEQLEMQNLVQRPVQWSEGERNGHIYYLLLENNQVRNELLKFLNDRDIKAVFHYIPLHTAPAGQRYGKAFGDLPHTIDISGRLLRMPLWVGLEDESVAEIIALVKQFFGK